MTKHDYNLINQPSAAFDRLDRSPSDNSLYPP